RLPSAQPGPLSLTAPVIPAVEPPRIEADANPALFSNLGSGAPSLAPPPAQRPKLALESVTGGTSAKPNPNPSAKLDLPKPTLQDLTKDATRSGGGGVVVGDIYEPAPALSAATPPVPCQTCSTLQLLSDPQSVDFTPYLRQVIAVVKHNWL